jgi:hypothetical protein
MIHVFLATFRRLNSTYSFPSPLPSQTDANMEPPISPVYYPPSFSSLPFSNQMAVPQQYPPAAQPVPLNLFANGMSVRHNRNVFIQIMVSSRFGSVSEAWGRCEGRRSVRRRFASRLDGHLWIQSFG